MRAASSFWDVFIATAAINFAFSTNFGAVCDWMLTSNLKRYTINVTTPSRTSIGYGILAGEPGVRYSVNVSVVLERVDRIFRIVTAFPRLL